jgi:hypothetical protein
MLAFAAPISRHIGPDHDESTEIFDEPLPANPAPEGNYLVGRSEWRRSVIAAAPAV